MDLGCDGAEVESEDEYESEEVHAFNCFLAGLSELGYGFAYRVPDAQFVRVDGLERAVPQRRQRVFVVGHLGDWRRAAAVLFERESLSGHPAPRREAGQVVAPTIAARTRGGGGLGTDFDCDGGLIPEIVLQAMSSKWSKGSSGPAGDGVANLIPVAHSLRAEGFDASEDGTGRGTPLVPIAQIVNGNQGSGGNRSWLGMGEPHQTLTKQDHGNYIAFDTTQITSAANYSNPKPGDPCHPLAAGAHVPAIAVADTLTSNGDAHSGFRDEKGLVPQGWAVRRLTPAECERLQGFPDGWTDVPYRGKPAADGPRYKALGNSMAVNVMRWIGRRIELVDGLEAALPMAAE
jgi:DNA (cytosine-5)-methyltransferase 1